MRGIALATLSTSSKVAIIATVAIALAACTSAPSPKGGVKVSSSKEYFAESEYGVKASPRVSNMRSRLPRGGGRDMVGKPYKVRGKWYKPKVEPNYSKVGSASWYGDAFHGRLTANGEIYDMTNLTAAHPTMPLPSYARVTNQKNGASVIVRVNDRGPFAHNRIIDLSKRAAEMLDYTHSGVAKVKVDYLGRAPLHGRDDQYLMASYTPGRGGAPRMQDNLPGIDDGQPSGVMIAMNGRTPTSARDLPRRSLFAALPGGRSAQRATAPARQPIAVAPQPVVLASAAPARSSRLADIVEAGDPVLPDFGPHIPERPLGGLASDAERLALPIMSYADRRVREASSPFDGIVSGGLTASDVVAAWKRGAGDDAGRSVAATMPAGDYLALGTFASLREAAAHAGMIAALGDVRVVRDADAYSVVAFAGDASLDVLARRAWQAGVSDAFVVRSE